MGEFHLIIRAIGGEKKGTGTGKIHRSVAKRT